MKEIASWNEGDWIAAIAAVALFAFLAAGAIIAGRKSEEFAGHPRGLFVLFYAEMWERFSYYGMRALLVLYLTKHWLFDDSKANLIYGSYGSLVYITPVLGGLVADRWLGQRKAVVFGGVLLALGHLLMAVEGHGGQHDPAINVFWLALSFIITGSGFLKANISVIVGQLYRMTDTRRDGAYTIFYMGVNVGAALGTILVGYLGETIGWAYGFGLAGIGMVLGLLIFMAGRPALHGKGEPPDVLLGLDSGLLCFRQVRPIFNGTCGRDRHLAADPVSGRDPEPADRQRRRHARLCALRGIEAGKGAARADLCHPVPDRAQPDLLGVVRAGGRQS